MARYLEEILAYHRALAQADDEDLGSLRRAADRAPVRASLRAALAVGGGVSVLAEIKRRSPSRGYFVPADHDVVARARAYERGGAAGISVLTDERFFAGSLADLEQVAHATPLPILRKDFIVDPRDVLRARAAGASAVLLIAVALQAAEVASLAAVAHDVGLEVVLEIHELGELSGLDRAAVDVVGVNQRNLATFAVDGERARRVADALPAGAVRLAESGVRGPSDLEGLGGFDAVLVGEALMRAEDPEAAVRELVERGARVRQDLRHHQSA